MEKGGKKGKKIRKRKAHIFPLPLGSLLWGFQDIFVLQKFLLVMLMPHLAGRQAGGVGVEAWKSTSRVQEGFRPREVAIERPKATIIRNPISRDVSNRTGTPYRVGKT